MFEGSQGFQALIGIFSQIAGTSCEFWVNPVNFTFQACGGRGGAGADAGDGLSESDLRSGTDVREW